MEEFLVNARSDLIAARKDWLSTLGNERRLAALTLEAYERDTRQFFAFLTAHLGGAPAIADISDLRPADLRAFLAHRRQAGAGPRTLARALAAIRSFLRYLEKRGQASAAGAKALRAPKQPKSLPKPLSASDARKVVSADGQLAEEPWIAARNAAVLTLLYGCGLRISEALGLDGSALSAGAENALRVARHCLENELKLTVNATKTHIAHSDDGVKFLGGDTFKYLERSRPARKVNQVEKLCCAEVPQISLKWHRCPPYWRLLFINATMLWPL
mgnify:CR=1 FL=1